MFLWTLKYCAMHWRYLKWINGALDMTRLGFSGFMIIASRGSHHIASKDQWLLKHDWLEGLWKQHFCGETWRLIGSPSPPSDQKFTLPVIHDNQKHSNFHPPRPSFPRIIKTIPTTLTLPVIQSHQING